jgi:trans-2,3-dihydro-3-hydroxyanthranilate isomerase
MLRFARETRLSETTFVQSAEAPGADYRNRIFTTLRELPFAGHPSLGTAVAVARERGQTSARYVQQTLAGLQPCEVELDGLRARASMLQEPPELGAPMDAAEALAAVGLSAADAHPELPAQPVSTGVLHIMIPVRDAEAVARATPDLRRLQELTRRTGAVLLYVVAVDLQAATARARGFFEDPSGAIEDPATGSAVGPLCAFLHHHAGLDAVDVDQGVEMGRPSRLEAMIDGDRVRVSGDCVIVLEGELLV